MIISNGNVIRYVKSKKSVVEMTVKQYMSYPEFDRELMSSKVDVILTDHETWDEKKQRYAKSVNWENYRKFWKKFDKGMKIFDDSLKEFDKEFGKHLGSNNTRPRRTSRTGKRRSSRRNYSSIPPSARPKDISQKIYGKSKSTVKVF